MLHHLTKTVETHISIMRVMTDDIACGPPALLLTQLTSQIMIFTQRSNAILLLQLVGDSQESFNVLYAVAVETFKDESCRR